MFPKKAYIFPFFLFCFLELPAQKIELVPIEVDKFEKQIRVPYFIREHADNPLIYEYNIQLFYSMDAGLTYNGPLERVRGHVGPHVLNPDSLRLILWDYWVENPGFQGVNVKFKIAARFEPSILNLKGPESTFRSLLIPGWGNSKVRYLKKKWHWGLVTLPTLGLIGGGIYMKTRSNNTYDQYLRSLNNPEANTLFARANRQNRLALGMIVTGASLWVADMAQVFVKGLINRKKQKRVRLINKKMGQEVHFLR